MSSVKVCNGVICGLYREPNIVGAVTYWRLRWAGNYGDKEQL
jgi:hypothetical protein